MHFCLCKKIQPKDLKLLNETKQFLTSIHLCFKTIWNRWGKATERIWMYQNFNCCSSDWMERTKYIQGRSGTKSKDCLPFVQYYKRLEKKIEKWEHLVFAFILSFSQPTSHWEIPASIPYFFLTSSQAPIIPFHLVKSSVQAPPSRVVVCPIVIPQLVFIPSLLRGSCAITSSMGL